MDVETMYQQVFPDTTDAEVIRDFNWPKLDAIQRASETNPLVIEPGEYHHEPGEFVISDEVETVLFYSYFYNADFRKGSRSAPGWTATTVYDTIKK